MNRRHDPSILAAPCGTRLSGDRGEGVISTAIAVLIIAFIGAGMWVAFNTIWNDAEGNISREVGTIGASAQP